METTPPSKQASPYEAARRQFEGETTDHEMIVLHDEGLYRHLRFKAPGTMMWHWDLITWPGYLSIVGDISEGHVFRRLADMFDFFHPIEEPWRINPQYWSEKLTGGSRTVRPHSTDQFEQVVREQAAEHAETLEEADQPRFTQALEDFLYWEPYGDAASAHDSISRFCFDDKTVFADTWEWDFTDYDHRFLISCFAIVSGIAKYKAAQSLAQDGGTS